MKRRKWIPLRLQLGLFRHPRPAHTWRKKRGDRHVTLALKRFLGWPIIPRRR
jgi:hypothetical protein